MSPILIDVNHVPFVKTGKRLTAMKFVCPQPYKWHEIHEALVAEWEKVLPRMRRNKSSINPPPVPLVLSGWSGSSGCDKNERWLKTIRWAEENRLAHLIPERIESEKYCVVEFSSWDGSTPGEYNITPRRKPRKDELIYALEILRGNWKDIVRSSLSEITFPVQFTGKKGRSLLVSAELECKPPWGLWNERTDDGDKMAFTKLRTSVNNAISPLAVDHINFVFPLQRK